MKLYKYSRYSEHLLSTLAKGTVWLSGPQHFNDIFDCQFQRTELTEKELVELKVINNHRKSEPNNEVALIMIRNNYADSPSGSIINAEYEGISSFILKFGILSLSEVPDSLLMWAHYAANHTGVCIEYEVDPEKISLRPVSYSTEYPTLSIYAFGVNILKETFREGLK